MDWNQQKVLVTGGASFISSHLIDELVAKGARSIRVVDDLTSGRLANIQPRHRRRNRRVSPGGSPPARRPQRMVEGIDVVFHLAAIHGGRGFVDLHQAACAQNLAMDGMLIKAAHEAGVGQVRLRLVGLRLPQPPPERRHQELYLTEEMVGPPYDADNMYGWAKLMTEMTLRSYARDFGFKSASCRFFTVYGERGVENHAVIAMIARAFVRQNPFEVWDGTQIRNWTYGDIVSGMVLAAEKIEDGTAVNLGTEERSARDRRRPRGAALHAARRPRSIPPPHADRTAQPRGEQPPGQGALLGWEPRMKFMDGLHRTIDWYFASRERETVSGYLQEMLTER